MTRDQILNFVHRFGDLIIENEKLLTDLDAAIGDADHGTNMRRGMAKVLEKLDEMRDKPVGAILKQVSMLLISTVGGASGPLYGSFFLNASRIGENLEELGPVEVQQLLDEGLRAVIMRGRAQPGEKTMVDAMGPAVAAFKRAIEAGKGLSQAAEDAFAASEAGMKDTIPMVARKGRASYLGERSRGHQDPGATSTTLLFLALRDVLRTQPE